jgi:alanine dehydrogenase
MRIGIIHTSSKKNEKRYPLHWKHLQRLDPDLFKDIIFEEGYPNLDRLDSNIKVNTQSREDVFKHSDLVILAKPAAKDYPFFREKQIVWGWPHCIQNQAITQVAIDKKLTLIAWENMLKRRNGGSDQRVTSRNSELAGYSSVIHALTLSGMTAGSYGEEMKAAVIGYGSTGKGAVKALLGLGCDDITVYSKRPKHEINDAMANIKYRQYSVKGSKVLMNRQASATELASYDIIVNCVLQNPVKPIIFLTRNDIAAINRRLLIVDVSCDKAMGFEFAEPTGFNRPTIAYGPVIYYAVDHTPSYFWQSASYEISGAIFQYFNYLLEHGTYRGNAVLENAVEIAEGRILNPKIIEFQHREAEPPYRVKSKIAM